MFFLKKGLFHQTSFGKFFHLLIKTSRPEKRNAECIPKVTENYFNISL